MSMIRKYHNYKLQANPIYRHRGGESQNNRQALGGQTKQSNQLNVAFRCTVILEFLYEDMVEITISNLTKMFRYEVAK